MDKFLASIGGAILFLWLIGLIGSCHHNSESFNYEEYEIEQAEKRRVEDSIATAKKIADSLDLVARVIEINKQYGQKNVIAVQDALASREYGNKYTADDLAKMCELGKSFTFTTVIDEIKDNGYGYNFSTRVEKRSELQKKFGRTRANKALSLTSHSSDAETILRGRVAIGYTKEMCRFAWGAPRDINRTSFSWGVHEQWCYANYNYLYFEDGILTTIQN